MSTENKLRVDTPLGIMYLVSDGTALTSALFDDFCPDYLPFPKPGGASAVRPLPDIPDNIDEMSNEEWFATEAVIRDSILGQALDWLTLYFSGINPGVSLPLEAPGTDFQQTVWRCLDAVPYGTAVTYGEMSERVAAAMSRATMSPRAVANALHANRICIFRPCHRIVAAHNIGGYAYDERRKRYMLQLESNFYDEQSEIPYPFTEQ